MTRTPLPGPGWHPDPHQPGYLRYWDGRAWTSHTSPLPVAPTTPIAGPRRSRSKAVWIVSGVAVLALLGASSLGDDSTPETTTALTADPTEEPAIEPVEESEPSAEPTPETAEVPDVQGLDRSDAERMLDRSGLSVGSIEKVWSTRPTGTVLEQGMRAGAVTTLGAAVTLVVAKTLPSVPGTAGRIRSAAVGALKAAGYRVSVSTETRTSGTDGAVLRQSPVGGTRLEPGSLIRVVVAKVVRPVVQAPSSCTPGYDPCLTPMSDYDCAGGSGDGPGYTGTVRVTGSDPYQLDNDGDGIACEA